MLLWSAAIHNCCGLGLPSVICSWVQARIDAAVKAEDQEATEMAAYLLRNDGLFVGSSSAINCVGAVKTARWLGPGHTVVGAMSSMQLHSGRDLLCMPAGNCCPDGVPPLQARIIPSDLWSSRLALHACTVTLLGNADGSQTLTLEQELLSTQSLAW